MQHSYFKIRDPWNFRPHKFEIGTPFIRSSFHDNHFLSKLYDLKEREFSDFYHFHLRHHIQYFCDGEQDFHIHVSELVSTRIAHFKILDPFSRKALRTKLQIERLKGFQKFLVSIDQWNSSKTLELIIAEKSEELEDLKKQIHKLQNELQSLRQYESSTKIDICEKHLPTFINLLHQLQGLTLPDGRKLFTFQGQSAWYKLLSKYFSHNGNSIPIETARNYFPIKEPEIHGKGTQVPTDLQHFKINLIKSGTSKS
ncbi:hypothetical protein [Dyadobacter sp. OTU695]|uniref:hypothetical protein n=1 Tax=Dyadobacter sp. OTU695 TaxID=3043860 RepID=UPI00313BECD5